MKGVRNSTKVVGAGSPVAVVHSRRINDCPPMVSGLAQQTFGIDPFNTYAYTSAVSGLASAYEFYRVRSAKVTLIPAGGSTNIGSLRCAFVVNPEMQRKAQTGVNADRSSILYSEQGCSVMSFSQGGTKTLDMSRAFARRWYSNNYIYGADDETFDRSIQATFLGEYLGTGTTSNCVLMIDIVVEFSGLGRVSLNTFAKALATYTVPYQTDDGSEEWPEKVELVVRSGKRATYVPQAPANPKPHCGVLEEGN